MDHLNQSNSKSKVSHSQFLAPPQLPAPRDDGDLSSSSDAGENPVSSATQLGDPVNPTAPRLVPLPSLGKFTKEIQARKASSGLNPTTPVDIQSQTSMKQNNGRSLEKRPLPIKSAKSAWHASSGTNSNLVISFSDDDSGSEPEENKSGKALEIKQNKVRVDGNQRGPSTWSAKSSKLQQTARNVKPVPKNLSIARTPFLPTAKVNKGVHSRVGGSSAIDQRTRGRNFVTLKRFTVNQENGFDQGNSSKLQDLRQQIALRERELKLKAAQISKEALSVAGKEDISMNLGADAARKFKAIAGSGVSLEINEPDRKRMKVGGSCSAPLASAAQEEILIVKSSVPLKEQASECSSLQKRTVTNHSQKGSPTRTESTFKWKMLDDKVLDVSSENPPNGLRDGADITSDHIQIDKRTVQHDVKSVHPSQISEHRPLVSFLKTSTSEKHLLDGCENHERISKFGTAEPPLDNVCRENLSNFSVPNYFGSLHDSENSNVDMPSLVEMEESLDKELDEAQEHRRICEIEERKALKAYRKAQRALVEANARCAELYHRRELYSAHLRSFILNDSSLLWSIRKHEYAGIRNHEDNRSKNLELILSPGHPNRPDYNGSSEPRYDSSVQRASGVPLVLPYGHVDQILGSEPCSERDASTSEPRHHNSKGAVNAVSSPSNDPNNSAEEDEETSPLDNAIVLPEYKNQQAGLNSVERQEDRQNQSNNTQSIRSSIDSMVLEDQLRSELFSRLGKRVWSKNSGSTNLDLAYDREPEVDNASEKTQTSNGSVPLSAEKIQEFETGGNDQSDREISGDPLQSQSINNQNSFCAAKGYRSTADLLVPASVLRSAFGHVKGISPCMLMEFQNRKKGVDSRDHGTCPKDSGEAQHGISSASAIVESATCIFSEEEGSFTSDLSVDPFWPLCMYELRGKCNNDQCPWQHARDFSKENVGRYSLDDSDKADFQVESTVQKTSKSSDNSHNCDSAVTPPTYLVSLDILRADPHACKTLVLGKVGQCWQKCFSICLALSNLLKKDVSQDELFLHGTDGRIEVVGNRDRQSAYFQSRNSTANHVNQILPTNMQALEMAFSMLCQEVNKLDGMRQALSVLSRAIEADPKSEVLWMTYLLIYYSNVKSVAKDDMFSYAVKNCDSSYGLWLMYIHSRLHLDDRLAAYDAALTALCHHSSAIEGDKMYVSSCILDLFLQMMDCLCISGNIAKAIQQINGLLLEANSSDQHHPLLISDILACLTISDKCMFWVCCVYLVIYRKLPEAVVHEFECDKKSLSIEWPRANILDEEKNMAVKLWEMAVDSVNFPVNSVSLGCQINTRPLQTFGVCHIGCMEALNGLEYCRSLLDAYMKLFPSCVEFAVISARFQMTRHDGLSPEGFEEILQKWPEETPGIQCIWNQYIECTLQKGYPEFAKELIGRWFDSFPEFQDTVKEKSDIMGSCSSDGSLEMASVSNPDNQIDRIFGNLNLSLAELSHDNLIEARNAIDRAYKAACLPYFKYCLKEHAAFLLAYDSSLSDSSFTEQLKVLKSYLEDAQKFPVSEPLPRQFINTIEKPRVQQLIRSILTPIPTDFCVVNLVLEVWYGPSLVPQNLSQPKELVDFVEAVLEIVPSNYKLVMSVCHLLIGGDNTSSSMLYWASSTLVNALLHAIPIAPEYEWVDAANMLNRMGKIESVSERFYGRALTVYPFSVKLWNCHYSLLRRGGDAASVVEAAGKKGITLG